MAKIEWSRNGAGWSARVGDITLFASPERATHFGTKAARGTKWRAGVTSWDEATSCASRFGRDVYSTALTNAKDAMRLAETVYREAIEA